MRPLWIWVLGFLSIVLVTFVFASLFLGGFGRIGFEGCGLGMMGSRVGGMMGPGYGGMMGPISGGMMGGWGPIGILGMLVSLFIPLALIALVVLGAVIFFRNLDSHKAFINTNTACPNCGRPVQGDWVSCPYCGKPLR